MKCGMCDRDFPNNICPICIESNVRAKLLVPLQEQLSKIEHIIERHCLIAEDDVIDVDCLILDVQNSFNKFYREYLRKDGG